MRIRTSRLPLLAGIAAIVTVALLLNVVHAEKCFKYVFEVDDEGATSVTVYLYDEEGGSSWLYVPKSQRGSLNFTVYEGRLINVTYKSLMYEGREDPFYEIMELHYEASKAFNASIKYHAKYGALIIEPRATFISPRVVHEGVTTNVVAYLPSYVSTSEERVSSASGNINDVKIVKTEEAVVVSAVIGHNDRLIIEYAVPREAEVVNVSLGCLVFRTPSRYVDFASEVLGALSRAYDVYKEVFDCELQSVYVEFFVPSRRDIALGVEGYVPIVGRELGPIHLNILYIRGVEGFMNVIAMHELAHHFLWHIGVPLSKLWIHEGVAGYLSLALGREMGYHGAVEIHEGPLKKDLERLSGRLGFVQKWTPSSVPPQEVGPYYAASYQVFSILCERYGGLDYLKKLFATFKRLDHFDWYDEYRVAEAFGEAAGDVEEVIELFLGWGFELGIASRPVPKLSQLRERVSSLPDWLEPYKGVAEAMIHLAEALQRRNLTYTSALAVKASQLVCDASIPLTITGVAIVVAALVLLKRLA